MNVLKIIAHGAISATLLTASISQVLAEDEQYVWRVTTHLPMASPTWEHSLVKLKNTLEERTDGRLVLDLYPADSLFGATELFNAVRRGVIPMALTSPAYLTDQLETAGIAFGLPGAFDEVWQAAHYFKNLGFEEIIREEAAGYGLYYASDKVYPYEMFSRVEIDNLETFEGMRIRVAGVPQTFLTNVGAAASFIPGTELYQALATGTFDAGVWGAVQEASNMGFYEVASYRVQDPILIGALEAYIINEDAIARLPGDIQDILKDTLEDHFWSTTIDHMYREAVALRKIESSQDITSISFPDDVREKMEIEANNIWELEGKKGDSASAAIEMLRSFRDDISKH